jgi:hypothetical protein
VSLHEPVAPGRVRRYLDRATIAFEAAGLPVTERTTPLARATSIDGTVDLHFVDADIAGAADLRFTGIQGKSTSIFSLMVFPHHADRVPIFASEFVVFGGIVRAAVADIQSVGEHAAAAARAPLGRLGSRWRHLQASGPLPEWCREHFTPESVFVLRAGVASLDTLDEALEDFLDEYVRLLREAPRGYAAADHCRAYKDHHIEHTPGRRYLTRFFGGDWCEAFLRKGMYR